LIPPEEAKAEEQHHDAEIENGIRTLCEALAEAGRRLVEKEAARRQWEETAIRQMQLIKTIETEVSGLGSLIPEHLRIPCPGPVIPGIRYGITKMREELDAARSIGFDPARPDGGIQQLVAEKIAAEGRLKAIIKHHLAIASFERDGQTIYQVYEPGFGNSEKRAYFGTPYDEDDVLVTGPDPYAALDAAIEKAENPVKRGTRE
jgi:hypothetical protein